MDLKDWESEYGYRIREQIPKLFEDHHLRLYRAAFRLTRNPEDAKEAVQAVFLKLLQDTNPQRDFIRNPLRYLMQAVTNTSLNIIRSRGKFKAPDEEVDPDTLPAPGTDEPENPAVERLRRATAQMKPRRVEALHLHYVGGYSYKEIAEKQGRNVGTVWWDLSTARRQVKKLMLEQEVPNERQKGKKDKGSRGTSLADAS